MGQITSAAAQVIISVIPIVGIVMGCVIIFFYLLWNHRRRTLMIKTGQNYKPDFNLNSFSLLSGLLLTSVGVALTVFLSIIGKASYGLLGGLIPLSMGVGLLAYYLIKRGEKPNV
jgi:heme/copper-type cytochrome/quinol oxidase subunit 2